jgi:hypothetical protein
MNWWAWLLVAIAAVVIVAFILSFQDIRRYLRIRHM